MEKSNIKLVFYDIKIRHKLISTSINIGKYWKVNKSCKFDVTF